MPVIHAPNQPTHVSGDNRFTSLATPTRGSAETSVWIVDIEPNTPAVPHSLTREEVFVVLSGSATVRIDGLEGEASPNDAIVVPADVDFEISNAGTDQLRLLCCFPVGGQARLADGTMLTPPWAQ